MNHLQQVLFVLLEIDLINMVLGTVIEIVQHKMLPGHIVDDVLHFLAKSIGSLRFLAISKEKNPKLVPI